MISVENKEVEVSSQCVHIRHIKNDMRTACFDIKMLVIELVTEESVLEH